MSGKSSGFYFTGKIFSEKNIHLYKKHYLCIRFFISITN
jgi:hypothetical protein